MFTLSFSNRSRYSKALRHLWDHSSRYYVVAYGKDYNAEVKDRSAGCGWYIHYLKIPA